MEHRRSDRLTRTKVSLNVSMRNQIVYGSSPWHLRVIIETRVRRELDGDARLKRRTAAPNLSNELSDPSVHGIPMIRSRDFKMTHFLRAGSPAS